jgi:hypothetical protein
MNSFDNFLRLQLPKEYSLQDLADDVAFFKLYGIPNSIYDERIQRLSLFFDLRNVEPKNYKYVIQKILKLLETKIPDEKEFAKAANEIKKNISYKNNAAKEKFLKRIKEPKKVITKPVGAIHKLPSISKSPPITSKPAEATPDLPSKIQKLSPIINATPTVEDNYVLSAEAKTQMSEKGTLVGSGLAPALEQPQTETVIIPTTSPEPKQTEGAMPESPVTPPEAIAAKQSEEAEASRSDIEPPIPPDIEKTAEDKKEAVVAAKPETAKMSPKEKAEKEKLALARNQRIKEYIAKDQKSALGKVEL